MKNGLVLSGHGSQMEDNRENGDKKEFVKSKENVKKDKNKKDEIKEDKNKEDKLKDDKINEDKFKNDKIKEEISHIFVTTEPTKILGPLVVYGNKANKTQVIVSEEENPFYHKEKTKNKSENKRPAFENISHQFPGPFNPDFKPSNKPSKTKGNDKKTNKNEVFVTPPSVGQNMNYIPEYQGPFGHNYPVQKRPKLPPIPQYPQVSQLPQVPQQPGKGVPDDILQILSQHPELGNYPPGAVLEIHSIPNEEINHAAINGGSNAKVKKVGPILTNVPNGINSNNHNILMNPNFDPNNPNNNPNVNLNNQNNPNNLNIPNNPNNPNNPKFTPNIIPNINPNIITPNIINPNLINPNFIHPNINPNLVNQNRPDFVQYQINQPQPNLEHFLQEIHKGSQGPFIPFPPHQQYPPTAQDGHYLLGQQQNEPVFEGKKPQRNLTRPG